MLPYFHSSKSGTQSSVQAAALGVQAGAECQFHVLLPWRGRRRCRDSTETLQFVHSSKFGTARANSGTLHSILYLEEKRDSNYFHAKQSLHTVVVLAFATRVALYTLQRVRLYKCTSAKFRRYRPTHVFWLITE